LENVKNRAKKLIKFIAFISLTSSCQATESIKNLLSVSPSLSSTSTQNSAFNKNTENLQFKITTVKNETYKMCQSMASFEAAKCLGNIARWEELSEENKTICSKTKKNETSKNEFNEDKFLCANILALTPQAETKCENRNCIVEKFSELQFKKINQPTSEFHNDSLNQNILTSNFGIFITLNAFSKLDDNFSQEQFNALEALKYQLDELKISQNKTFTPPAEEFIISFCLNAKTFKPFEKEDCLFALSEKNISPELFDACTNQILGMPRRNELFTVYCLIKNTQTQISEASIDFLSLRMTNLHQKYFNNPSSIKSNWNEYTSELKNMALELY
jgi:hypothetical protein